MRSATMERLDDWLAEVANTKQKGNDSGFTSRELTEKLKIGQDTANKIIRQLFRAGRIECIGKRRAVRCDGAATLVPCYQLKPVK